MLKQYIFIPRRLGMSTGKIASQVAHATFMALEKEDKKLIQKWKKGGMCVIVLECSGQKQLFNTYLYLKDWDIVNHLYIDEGSTEVEAMTPTILATGIIDDTMQWMFSNFKLYDSSRKSSFVDLFK